MEWLDYQVLRNPLWRWLAALGVRRRDGGGHPRAQGAPAPSSPRHLRAHPCARGSPGRRGARAHALVLLPRARSLLGSLLLHFHHRPQHSIEIGAVLVLLAQIGAWGQHAIRVSVDAWQIRHDGQPGPSTMAAGIAFLGQLALWIVIFLMALFERGHRNHRARRRPRHGRHRGRAGGAERARRPLRGALDLLRPPLRHRRFHHRRRSHRDPSRSVCDPPAFAR